jgi:hypothetical protein
MPSDAVSTINPAASRADFTYAITLTTLVIKDTGAGHAKHLPAKAKHLTFRCYTRAECLKSARARSFMKYSANMLLLEFQVQMNKIFNPFARVSIRKQIKAASCR